MNSRLFSGRLRRRSAVFTAFAVAALSASAFASPILLVNGGFEQTLLPGSYEFGSRYPDQQVIGWTSTGYNFVMNPGVADTTGATSEYGANDVSIWGPGNGSANGLPASSPDGGNYLAMDGAYLPGPVSQMINNLVIGKAYEVSFYFAGAQQYGYTGPTTEGFQVSLGTDMQTTAILDDDSHGFTGWQQETFTFTAYDTSELLSFLAVGTPGGEPPFSLLDGVDVAPVPEPGSLALMATGLSGVAGLMRMRFRKNTL